MQKNLAQKGQKFILGFVKADQSWFVGTYNNDKLLAAIKAMGIDVVDMTLASTNETLEKKYYIHELDKHPSAVGNEARSNILFNYWKR